MRRAPEPQPPGAGAREAAERLRQVGLGNLLAAARQSIERNDGVRGTVVLDGDPEIHAALADLIGWRRLPGPVGVAQRLPLARLDAALRASRFATDLLSVLEADGGPVQTRRQHREQAAARAAEQMHRIAAAVPAGVRERLIGVLAGAGPCGLWYRRAYRERPAVAERSAVAVGGALSQLPATPPILLAVFAARVTGDPHAFDRGQPAGGLLYAALREFVGAPPEDLGDAEAWAYVLDRSGLEVDDLSSTVLAARLVGAQHPVLAAMAAGGAGWPLPLRAVAGLTFASTGGRPVFIVENPQVFAHLVRATSERSVGLVCTRGFLSAAAIRLLDALASSGHLLWYGGDFDRNGLAIAAGLLRRYAGLRVWRMAPGDYAAAVAGREVAARLPPADLAWLRRVEGPLAATARAMARGGVPAYQERLVDHLLRDLRAADSGGC